MNGCLILRLVLLSLLVSLPISVAGRVAAQEEGLGLDVSQHGEEAYARDEGAILVLPDAQATPAPASMPALEPEGGRA